MKALFLLIGLTFFLSFAGCGGDKVSMQLIDQAEAVLETNPDSAPNYLALAGIYRESCDYEKARFYVNKASISSYNEYVPVSIVYDSYLIEKADNNPAKAFMYLEKYILMTDSIRGMKRCEN